MKPSTKFLLASGSPRRKQLLEDAGFSIDVKTVSFDEVFPEDMEAIKVAEFLAIGKNKAHREVFGKQIILTADTVVIFNNIILGKPESSEEAINTLKLLSGKIHQVVTGVCISSKEKAVSFSSSTEVQFKDLSEKEINYYVDRFKPFDKAGSYAIQEWIGLIGIKWIKGSYYNVVGLPVEQVYTTLTNEFEVYP